MPDRDDPPRDERGRPVHPETGLPVGDVEPEYTPTLAVAPNGAEMPHGGTDGAPERPAGARADEPEPEA